MQKKSPEEDSRHNWHKPEKAPGPEDAAVV